MTLVNKLFVHYVYTHIYISAFACMYVYLRKFIKNTYPDLQVIGGNGEFFEGL